MEMLRKMRKKKDENQEKLRKEGGNEKCKVKND